MLFVGLREARLSLGVQQITMSILPKTSAELYAFTQATICIPTLLIVFWQILLLRKQLKLQASKERQSEYLRTQVDFTESMRLLLKSHTHDVIYDSLKNHGSVFRSWGHYEKEDKIVYAYFEIVYELFERIYVMKEDEWIDDTEWIYWEPWISDVKSHPILADVVHDNLGMYDKRFEDYVQKLLPNTASAPMLGPVTSRAAARPAPAPGAAHH